MLLGLVLGLSMVACDDSTPSTTARTMAVGVFGHHFDGPLFDSDEMIPFLAEIGLNTYVYTDDWARERLSEPHTPEGLDRLRAMADLAATHGVMPVYNMKPTLGYTADAPFPDPQSPLRSRALDAVVSKVEAGFGAGIRIFMFAFDDVQIRARDSGLMAAEAQTAMVLAAEERLSELDPNARLWVVTPYYQGTAAAIEMDETVFSPGNALNLGLAPSKEFVDAYRALPPHIEIFSTGSAIHSDGLTVTEARDLAALWDHPLMFWHNFPVNNLFEMELVLQPFGRVEPALMSEGSELSAVILHRMANNLQASKIALYTFADFVADPGGYDPSVSYDHAIARLAEGAPEALRLLADQFQSHPVTGPPTMVESVALRDAIDGFWVEHTACTSASATDTLETLLVRFTTVRDELEAGLVNVDLLAEMRPHADKLVAIGQAGLLAVQGLIDACAGAASLCETAATLRELHDRLNDMPSKITEDSVPINVIELIGSKTDIGPSDIVGDFLNRAFEELNQGCDG